jgi:hypothetical protein
VIAIWLEFYFRKRSEEDAFEEDEIKKKKCWPDKSPGVILDDAMTKFFQM